MREEPNGLRKRALVERGSRVSAGNVSFNALQTVNVALFAGGIFLLIAVSVELMQRVASYESQGLYADGDVIKGPAFVIMTALMTAVLAACAFMLLRIGQRWACWIDVLIWAVAWFPAGINLNAYIQGFGYQISGLVCALGILLAVVTYFQMSSANRPPRDREATA